MAAMAPACSSSDAETASPGAAVGTTPAVMVSTATFGPDGRSVYVGAFPDIPTGDVGTERMAEFGNAYVYTYGSAIFVWDRDALTVTRYEVDDAHELVKGQTLSFTQFGLQFSADHLFVSPTRAYVLLAAENLIVVWNPETMQLTTTFPANLPPLDGLDTYAAPVGVSGENVYWALLSTDYDSLKVYPKNVLVVAPVNADGPVTIVEDERCVPSLGGYIVNSGDVYLVGGADADALAAYNPAGTYPNSCILRVRAGSMSFDPDYRIDLLQAANTPSVVGSWLIDDASVLLRVWDASDPLPSVIDEYWSASNFISKRIALADGQVEDFPDPPKGGFTSNVQYRVDGATYLSLPNADGSADIVYRIAATGTEPIFTIPGGSFWGLGRLR